MNNARRRAGFTLVETLVTLVIFALVSGSMAAGVRFGMEQYQRSVRLSEAKLLCSTLASVIRGELANTSTVELGAENADGLRPVLSFFSPNYAMRSDLSALLSVTVAKEDHSIREAEDGFGELMLGQSGVDGVTGNLLINSASYSSLGLRANAQVGYNPVAKLFTVTLRIRSHGSDDDLIVSTFHVLPLNSLYYQNGDPV